MIGRRIELGCFGKDGWRISGYLDRAGGRGENRVYAPSPNIAVKRRPDRPGAKLGFRRIHRLYRRPRLRYRRASEPCRNGNAPGFGRRRYQFRSEPEPIQENENERAGARTIGHGGKGWVESEPFQPWRPRPVSVLFKEILGCHIGVVSEDCVGILRG